MKLWNFGFVEKELFKLKGESNYTGYGLLRIFKCLLLQFLENLSDRELEKYLQENVSAKWFCGFDLLAQVPSYSIYCRARERIGTENLAKIFKNLRDQLKTQGYMNEVFSFVDATNLIAKAKLWEERDEAIKQKYEKLNNEILPKVACDKEARIGCKGKENYWYGYKKHVSVDMQSGLINKVAITPANTTDANGFKHVCPTQGAVYGDKGYCTNKVAIVAKSKNCHLAVIKKNNMKEKNRDQDRWYSKIRAPYERVFSQQPKRVKYRGTVKNQFAAFMEAICFNLKRLAVLNPTNLYLS